MYHAKGRWIDQNGRSHNWSGDVASSDRNQVKSQIYAQTGAKDVIITGVTGSDAAAYNEDRKRRIAEENERRREQTERLESGSTNGATYSNTSHSYSYDRESNSNSSDPGSILGLILVAGGIWAFITFMPWVLMIVYGSAATWSAEKITGQSVEEYSNTKNPDDKQSKKALIVFVTAVFFGGLGFVQGSGWQKGLNSDTPSNQPKVEEVRQK